MDAVTQGMTLSRGDRNGYETTATSMGGRSAMLRAGWVAGPAKLTGEARWEKTGSVMTVLSRPGRAR